MNYLLCVFSLFLFQSSFSVEREARMLEIETDFVDVSQEAIVVSQGGGGAGGGAGGGRSHDEVSDSNASASGGGGGGGGGGAGGGAGRSLPQESKQASPGKNEIARAGGSGGGGGAGGGAGFSMSLGFGVAKAEASEASPVVPVWTLTHALNAGGMGYSVDVRL